MKKIECSGFKAAGLSAGLKKNGKKDLGLIYSNNPASAAGAFTCNRVQAAPVKLDQQRIQSGQCQAIIVNSGNANCCTGGQGIRDAEAMASYCAEALGIPEKHVLVASTGVIGQPMPMDKIQAAVPSLVEQSRPDGFEDFAAAIMTTDTVPKIATEQVSLGDNSYTILGVAKGAGMIRPDMATMLCFVCTDAEVAAEDLKEILHNAVMQSFNHITIDGDTSTNDTVLLLANGASGATVTKSSEKESFQAALNDVLFQLARALVKDGEGATKLVEIVVKGAATAQDARTVAETIAHSNLVKTALFGEDANWGRIMAATGRAKASVVEEKIDIFFDTVQMVAGGIGKGEAAEGQASQVLKKPEFSITVDLNLGSALASVLTCDFSLDYVRINADYRS